MNTATSFDVSMWACITCSLIAESITVKWIFLSLAGLSLVVNTIDRLKK